MNKEHSKIHKLNNKDFPIFNYRYSALWDDLKLGNNEPPKYQLIFIGRRFLISILIVIPPQLNIPPIFQFQMLICLNIYFAGKVKVDKPYIKNGTNMIEFINECYTIFLTNLLFSMAPCSDIEDGPSSAE